MNKLALHFGAGNIGRGFIAPVLKESFVALDEELKSPSETASIPAATKIASVPAPSSGAWKKIEPNTSSCAISLSPA